MRVHADNKGGGYTAAHDAVSLKATASDEEGHLAEVQIADMGDGSMNVVLGGDCDPVRTDPAGNLIIRVWTQGERERQDIKRRRGSRSNDRSA